MKMMIEKADEQFLHTLFGEPVETVESGSAQTETMRLALQNARAQRNVEVESDWKRNALFLALFVFLYAALGAFLTLDLSTRSTGHKSLDYALQAVPVLIAFSGFFLSLLFLFVTRSSARRLQNWERAIVLLEKYTGGNLYKQIMDLGARTTHYSFSAINVALALFICVTWVVMYNFFTFTTSGVIGSVISLFITTMTYVILDIQLLKPHRLDHEEPVGLEKEEKQEDKGSSEEKPGR
ncbi:MAG: hypothetical protein E6556_20050 [Pantoea sp.]|uniref:RipA family octameric membrane protein n=1 Tax=Pantoea piersonii TaxID=2364647 RepID=UPI0028A20498|nr:hypothetical protein [Pantoea piersonii]MDU6434999.1 hypothetical protein [Pantoea sp.]